MLKVARNLARRVGADAVVTGESLGQVASQTLYNLVSEQADLGFPVLRPLIGMDKLEIEGIAKASGPMDNVKQEIALHLGPYRRRPFTTPDLMRSQEVLLDLEPSPRRRPIKPFRSEQRAAFQPRTSSMS
jgi:thiamine biosynthesis protein ThiI